jgi:hypothetical protein
MVAFGFGKNGGMSPIEPSWVKWLENQINILKPDGVLALPLKGLAYRLDKSNKVATLIAVADTKVNSGVRSITDRIFVHLGWKVVMDKDAVKKDVNAFLAVMLKVEGGKALIDESIRTEVKKMFGV